MHLLSFLPLLSFPLLSSAQIPYPNQSAPFNLVLTSANETLNNARLTSCHSGAAIESLCLDTSEEPPSESQTFYYNTTDATTPTTGILVWDLIGGNFVESEAMVFQYNPTSNVALPLFEPSSESAQQVLFDATTDELGIPLQIDDTVTPPFAIDPTEAGQYPLVSRWYVCQTYFEGYTYYTLAWKLGNEAEPQNPSCQAVTVRRVFTT